MYLGIDLGTSGLKVLLVSEEGAVMASASEPLLVERSHFGWSEQNPQAWIDACERALDKLTAQCPCAFSALRGIGLSGQMHGAVLLDSSLKPLRPAILWNDTRSHEEAAKLNSDPRFQAISGNIVFPGFTAPKIMWTEANEPATFSQIGKILLPKDYLRLWLTGDSVSEMSDASGTSWLDVANRCWSPELLGATNIALEHMPALVEGTDPSGQLRRELTQRWGVKRSIPVAGGGGDNAATAVALGVVRSNTAFVSLGTSGVLFVAADRFRPKPETAIHTFCHALPDYWHQMGVILSATDALNWLSELTTTSSRSLTEELGQTLKPPARAVVLPYFAGERTPHNDANVRAALLGVERTMDRVAMTQAILEGVAFAFRDNLTVLEDAGAKISRITATGGGAACGYWLQV
ncbi:MAG: xylulokinase, partial [Hyphomicrobiaceae bacterium]